MPDSLRLLNVRSVPLGDRASAILNSLDALAPGDALIVSGDSDVTTPLRDIQAGHPADFDWNVLEAGDNVRVEIRRRADGVPRSITDYLENDHDRLDDILREVTRLMSDGAQSRARERFAEFCCGLDRHITVEEEILFPHFERATGLIDGPTTVMRAEHVQIRHWMASAEAALARGEPRGFADAVERLIAVLEPHNMKEERILYPMADQATGSVRAQDALVRQMQTL